MKYPLWNLCQVSILRYTVLVDRSLTTRRMSVFMLLSFLSCLILSDLASAEPDIGASKAIADQQDDGSADHRRSSSVCRRCVSERRRPTLWSRRSLHTSPPSGP